MNNSMIVRQATIEDLNGTAALFDEYRCFYGKESDIEAAKLFLFERFEHRESVIFIAFDEADGKEIGFTQLYPSFSSLSMKRVWILNDLFVRPAYRKRGAGKQLLGAAHRFAALTKAKGLELSTAMSNDSAQALYESSGYIKDDDFYHYFFEIK